MNTKTKMSSAQMREAAVVYFKRRALPTPAAQCRKYGVCRQTLMKAVYSVHPKLAQRLQPRSQERSGANSINA